LLAFCNFGPACQTFASVQELDDMSNDEAIDFMKLFAMADMHERRSMRMCQCPVFLKRSWLLGQSRLTKLQDECVTEERVQKSLERASEALRCGFLL
jgi:hypothetical protein